MLSIPPDGLPPGARRGGSDRAGSACPERLRDQALQRRETLFDGLLDEPERTGAKRLDRPFRAGQARHRHAGKIEVEADDAADQLQSVHPRQLEVGEDDIDASASNDLERLARVADCRGGAAHPLQGPFDRATAERLVLDHQDVRREDCGVFAPHSAARVERLYRALNKGVENEALSSSGRRAFARVAAYSAGAGERSDQSK